MSEYLKIGTIRDLEDQGTKITDLESMFDIYLDERGNYVFNLNETVYFMDGIDRLPTYVSTYRQYWTTLSYNIYGTTRLAWLLMKVNDVTADNVFRPIENGESIRYVPSERIQ